MSPIVRYILLAVAACALAFGFTYAWLQPKAAAEELDELVWIQKEFRLTPEQTAAIAQLHTDYQPICMDHCSRILRARAALTTASDKVAAQAELERLTAVCHEATRAHLQRVASVMSPTQGARFLSIVSPKVEGQSHDAPLGLK